MTSAAAHAASPLPPPTVAEQSGYRTTGRYDEVERLCAAWQKARPEAVRCFSFGQTPEGRPMMALAISQSGALTPEAARQKGLPVVLMQSGIHAGEIDGKDAGFQVLREVLEGRAAPGALKKAVWLFVPVFNVDGHERFGVWNRPNQRGPEEMGWRTNAQNLNLNRDYLKADAPEMQAMLQLVNHWDPLATVDLHVTDGAKFEHDVAVMVEPVNAGDAALRSIGRQWRDTVISDIAQQGSLPLAFYPSFETEDDPASGFRDSVSPPRFSTGYFLLRNRLGMLVETHSWKDYPTRVRVTRNIIVSVLAQMAAHGAAWRHEAEAADARSAQLAGAPMPLDYVATDKSRTIAFRGYAYTRTPSEISGTLMTRYDESKPEIWQLPLWDEVVPRTVVRAPRGGYLVPAGWAATVARWLDLHGLRYQRLGAALPAAEVQAWRSEEPRFAAESAEGRQRLSAKGEWHDERQALPRGSLFVPIAQPRVRLVMAMLEPEAPDGLLGWGVFNTAFIRQEYMEPYVTEEVAREMLARDPAVADAFRDQLANDPAFAADPQARLDFFYRRHASWDDRFGLYPVLRTDTVPAL